MRIQTQVKIHEAKGPRLPYRPEEAEFRENELVYVTSDGIAIADGEGVLYWVDFIATSDAGGGRVYDEQSAAGNTLSASYSAKAPDSQIKTYDPPKIYKHGIYVDVTTGAIEICYKPYARNLRCKVSPVPVYTKALTCRLVTRQIGMKALVSKVIVRVSLAITKALVSRVRVYNATVATKALVSQVTVRKVTSKSLVCHLYADRTE